MGAVKADLSAKERRLDETYALDNPLGVRLLLTDYHALVKRQYDGDYDAVVILADLAKAVEIARLTDRQMHAIYYVFIEDRTQVDATKAMGIDRSTVAHYVNDALTKIAEVYEYWALHGEGYNVNKKGAID